MNITKRMLQFGAAAVAVAIGSNALAAGLWPVSESFESYDEGDSATNLTEWASTSVDDASIITNLTYSFAPATDGITFPLPAPATEHTQVLKLNTEGGTLSVALDRDETTFSESQYLYVDTMVNMVISEDDPSFAGVTNKVAVFANATSNLVIRHGMYAGPIHSITNSDTGLKVNPTNWYRLTITMKRKDIEGTDYSLFSAAVDGITITNDNVREDSIWFDVGAPVGATDYDLLPSVAFQGTGFIDDLVVTRTAPAFAPVVPVGPLYVYVIEEVIDGGATTYLTVATPEAGWNKAYTPADTWTKIGLGGGSAAIFTLTNSTVYAPDGVSDNEMALRGTNRVEVLTNVAMTAGELGGQFSGLTQDQLDWVKTFGHPSSTALYTSDNSIAFEQAMKLDPYVNEDVTVEITAFVVGDPDSTITVTVSTNDVAYTASPLTAKLVVDSKENLATEWTMGVFSTNVTSLVAGETSIEFATPAPLTDFFRARIVEQ